MGEQDGFGRGKLRDGRGPTPVQVAFFGKIIGKFEDQGALRRMFLGGKVWQLGADDVDQIAQKGVERRQIPVGGQ